VTNETNVQETPVPAEETTEVTEESEPEVAVTKKPSKKAEKKTDSAEKTEEKKPAKRLELPSNTHINMSDIDLPEMWNRDSAGDLKGLTQSIQTGGQKVPVLVRPNPEKPGRWLLVDGRRRYMVMQSIKAKTIMAVVSNDATEAEAQRTAIVVNLARAGHNPVEIATAFQFCIDSGMKQKEIALEGGFSDGYVSQHLAILDFPEDIIKLTKRYQVLQQAHVRHSPEEPHARRGRQYGRRVQAQEEGKGRGQWEEVHSQEGWASCQEEDQDEGLLKVRPEVPLTDEDSRRLDQGRRALRQLQHQEAHHVLRGCHLDGRSVGWLPRDRVVNPPRPRCTSPLIDAVNA
jgi:ParB/RepB/Spo0J family partition protein